MVIDPAQLLRKLEPAVRPPSAPATAAAGCAPLERQTFDELMSLVSRGTVHSGRKVTVAAGARLAESLDEGQFDRLAAAADLAEGTGAGQAVMLIDGRGLVLDVTARSVTGELGGTGGDQLIDIDAAVYVAGEDDEDAAMEGLLPPPATTTIHPAVARQLHDAADGRGQLEHDGTVNEQPPARRAG
jgi:hypothetical protein